ncbi:hypothetical protein AB7W88_11650 [Providencia vermicola]|uniref:hypothetical protein n=1 Tax=Providencia TaxID=586 RepID=UPI0022B7105F|nr:hypothetical protein O7C57_06445 [Providencia sp. 21OH12SH02B-Prov]
MDIIGWGEPEYVSSTPSWDVTSNDIIKAAHPDEKESWHLDYIFAKNVASIKEQTRQVKMKTAYYYNNNAYYDYSDHYPVVAEIEL